MRKVSLIHRRATFFYIYIQYIRIHTFLIYFLNIFSCYLDVGATNTTEPPSVPGLIHSLAVITVQKLKRKAAKEQEHLTSCCSSKVCDVSVAVE